VISEFRLLGRQILKLGGFSVNKSNTAGEAFPGRRRGHWLIGLDGGHVTRVRP
jgi:hypothetical protein